MNILERVQAAYDRLNEIMMNNAVSVWSHNLENTNEGILFEDADDHDEEGTEYKGIDSEWNLIGQLLGKVESSKYARVCSITGEGMNEGWVFVDDSTAKYESDVYKELEGDTDYLVGELLNLTKEDVEEDVSNNVYLKAELNPEKLTGPELLSIAFAVEYVYWTSWYDEEDEMIYDIFGTELN